MSKNKKYLSLSIVLVLIALTLNACTFFPLPDSQRYERINNVKNQIDFEHIDGKVLEERYDNGDGVFSPSFWYFTIEGETEAFDFLKKEITNINEVECVTSNSTDYLSCNVGVVDVILRKTQRPDNVDYISIKITDVLGGREGKS